jgi:hypothetical protein
MSLEITCLEINLSSQAPLLLYPYNTRFYLLG